METFSEMDVSLSGSVLGISTSRGEGNRRKPRERLGRVRP